MKNISLFFSLMLCVTLFSGCATIFCKTRTVTVTSDVDNADVYYGSKYVGKTPLSFDTKKAKMTMSLQKKGYESQTILINRKVNNVVWLDCLWGIGGLVDLCSGRYWKLKETDYYISLTDPSINQAHNDRINKKYEWVNTVVAPLATATMAGATAYGAATQAENARKAEEKRIKEEQRNAELQARMMANDERNSQRMSAIEQREIDRRNAAMANNPQSTVTARSMDTSDLTQYQASQLSDAVYGVATTNQALTQQRQYDADRNQQVQAQQRQIDQEQRQMAQSQQGSVVNAVTVSGNHVQIRVNGSQVIAYSLGNSLTGPEWSVVVPAANVIDTSNPLSQASSDVSSRFAYQASVRGLGIVYWGTPTRRVITDAPSGTPVKAVTRNGQTLTIMVNGKKVVAYGSGLNQATDIQWHTIMPNAAINETNNSFDGELATRFMHKAELPGIGTIYF